MVQSDPSPDHPTFGYTDIYVYVCVYVCMYVHIICVCIYIIGPSDL